MKALVCSTLTGAMSTNTSTSLQCLWRIAMMGLFCKFQWDCYLKYAEGKIATATTSKQARYQSPFSISMCPINYKMPEAHEDMVRGTTVPNTGNRFLNMKSLLLIIPGAPEPDSRIRKAAPIQ